MTGHGAEVRMLTDERDLVAAANVFRAAMVAFPPLGAAERGRVGTLFEPGRTLGAFLGGELVGTTDSAASTLTLPGGRRVGHAAVTHVGVLPSRVRRGIGSALLERQLHELHDRGDVVASLRASEATIYGRFGYGVASSSQTFDVRAAAFRRDVAAEGRVELIDVAASWDLLPRICDRVRSVRPGAIDRPAGWWEYQRLRAERDGSVRYVAAYGDPGAETGFVRYHPIGTETWFTSTERTVLVDDLYAPTPDAYRALVRFLVDLPLVDRLVFTALPVDDPLPWLLSDRRAARVTDVRDETWLRVLDVPAALAARSLRATDGITVTVKDAVLEHNSATFHLSANGAERTERSAELRVAVDVLGALLLGGVSWAALHVAGLVEAQDPGAIARADALFGAWPQPHAGITF